MGIFSYNMKEGPGVSKDERKKKGVFLYIDIVFRKFLKLIQANMMYLILSIPYLIIAFALFAPMVMNAFGMNLAMEGMGDYSADEMTSVAEVFFRTAIALFLFNYFGSGPAAAAYAYATRCYTRGEHTWLISDAKDKIKENFKQSILLLILDLIVIILAMNAAGFYSALMSTATGGMATAFQLARYVTLMATFIYMVMHIYIYQIMVTYECKFIDLLKNSAIMALAKLPMTIVLTVITAFVFFLSVRFIAIYNPFAFALVYGVLGMTFMRYPLEFYAARVIEKNIRAQSKKQENSKAKITYDE